MGRKLAGIIEQLRDLDEEHALAASVKQARTHVVTR